METLRNLIHLPTLGWQPIVAAIVVYLGTLAFYRLTLHPLSHFPGPKLAAVTRWYEAYYDVVRNGQYTFKIAELHRKYGKHCLHFFHDRPIIRISPYELHVIDPAFFEKLYRQDGRWNKYEWTYAGFGALGSSIGTASHETHKARRQPLNPFFSKAKVAARHDIVERDVYKLCDRVAQFAARGSIINLGIALSALTRDVACEFALNKKYDFLGKEDFDIGMTNALQAGGHIWRITKHVPWFGPAMKSIPPNLLMKMADEGTKGFFRFIQEHEQDTKDLLAAAAATSPNDEAPRTIVHEIMDSDLPEADKSFKRVFDDVATVTGAGFETTASVMRLVLYHVYSNPQMLQRLRAELDGATSKPPGNMDVKTLEQLPYLTSLIMEGMRLSPAIGSRMARIAPDRDLFYGDLRIPAGTPVGMTTILMHTDENLYPEPLRFDPERWTDVDARKSKDKTYAPFSRGTRDCIGRYLGWAMLYMTLAELVQRFDIDFVDAVATDFEMESDQFIIGTRGRTTLESRVKLRKIL